MAISCPTCGAPAELSGQARAAGRMIRCARCGTGWLARSLGSDPYARPHTRPIVIPGDISDAIVIDDAAPPLARPALPPPWQGAVSRIGMARPAFSITAIAVAAAIGIALLKGPIVAALPGLTTPAAAATGLEFRDITSRAVVINGGRTVVVEGQIVNTLGNAVELPALRITLKGREGTDVASWTVQPSTSQLAAGQSVSFRSARASPPEGATQVTLSLAN